MMNLIIFDFYGVLNIIFIFVPILIQIIFSMLVHMLVQIISHYYPCGTDTHLNNNNVNNSIKTLMSFRVR